MSVDFNTDPRFRKLLCVVDLTAEFPALRRVHGATRQYICCPSLDRLLADPKSIAAAAAEALRMKPSGDIYVHCKLRHFEKCTIYVS